MEELNIINAALSWVWFILCNKKSSFFVFIATNIMQKLSRHNLKSL
jgi:hypothetical protein